MNYYPYQLKESRWQQQFTGSYSLTQRDYLVGKSHGTIIIPGNFSSPYIRLEFSTWNIPKTWYLAGFLNQYYSNDAISNQLLESFKIPINVPKIIEVNKFSSSYQLTFRPIERVLNFSLFLYTLDI